MNPLPTNIANRLLNFDMYIIVLLLCMPLILVASNNWILLSSISAYGTSLSKQPQILPILLSILATMFAVKDALTNNKFNILLGISLIGVASFTAENNPITHFICAGFFFAATTFKMVYKTPSKYKKTMQLLALVIVFGMAGHLIFKWYSMFWAECIAFLPAAFYYVSKYLIV